MKDGRQATGRGGGGGRGEGGGGRTTVRGRSASTGKHLHHGKSCIFSPETGNRRMEATDMSIGQIKKCKEHICKQTDSVGVEGREEGIGKVRERSFKGDWSLALRHRTKNKRVTGTTGSVVGRLVH